MDILEIIALLTARFSGTRKDGLKQLARVISLQCATKEEAEAAVNKLTDAQVNQFIKDFRADVDSEVTKGVQKSEKTLREKYGIKDDTEPEPGGGGKSDPTDIAAIVEAAVNKAVKPYADRIASMELADLSKSRLQKLNDALANCKDETFKAQTLKDFARMQFADDAAFNEYLTEKTTDITTANQNFNDNQISRQGGAPLFTSKDDKGVSQAVQDFIASKSPDNDPFKGKEI